MMKFKANPCSPFKLTPKKGSFFALIISVAINLIFLFLFVVIGLRHEFSTHITLEIILKSLVISGGVLAFSGRAKLCYPWLFFMTLNLFEYLHFVWKLIEGLSYPITVDHHTKYAINAFIFLIALIILIFLLELYFVYVVYYFVSMKEEEKKKETEKPKVKKHKRKIKFNLLKSKNRRKGEEDGNIGNESESELKGLLSQDKLKEKENVVNKEPEISKPEETTTDIESASTATDTEKA